MVELESTRKKLSQSHYRSPRHITEYSNFVVRHDYKTELMGPYGLVSQFQDWSGPNREPYVDVG